MKTLHLDLIIVGGGVAGLWTLNRAVKAGYNAILLEKDQLGGGQSVRSQGIIHGGTKYALNGVLTQAANAISAMPARWRDCLHGRGELDLSSARVLSEAHYMWSRGSLGSKMTTFFASKALRGRVNNIPYAERPQVFQHPDFSGALYRLNELVLDVPSVVAALAAPVAERIFQLDASTLDYRLNATGAIEAIELPEAQLRLSAQRIALTPGEGFAGLAARLRLERPAMQRRPLHMVMVKHSADLPLFAHCIGTGSKPVVTITSHPCRDGSQVWYLGGDLAETGVERNTEQQIRFAQDTLHELLPWVELANAQWACLRIDRAEPAQSSLVRPDAAFAQAVNNCIVAWPTKLALAPDLADRILELLPPAGAAPCDLSPLLGLKPAPVAQPVWETLF